MMRLLAALLCLACLAAAAPDAGWTVPDINTLPATPWGQAVRYGHDLITRTPTLIGPDAARPAMRFAGNHLACANCHLDAGTQKFGLPLVGAFANYPQYRARGGTVATIEDRIEGCMTRSMNGKALPRDSPPLIAIVAYLKFLAQGRTVGVPVVGEGARHMPELTRAASPGAGRQVFATHCAVCHGVGGQGLRAGQKAGYVYPPLWGPDSYNDGAGMNRLITAANFIHANMPRGATWQHPALSVAQAWDVAAYLQAQPRPAKANLARDYPHLSEKPIDTPYGPYADHAAATQHRLGPFAPLRAEK